MIDLVIVKDRTAMTTTLAIAEGTESPHASVIKLARKYRDDLGEFGSLGFEIQVTRKDGRGGEPTEYALLNEPQATLLLTYMRNSDVVRQFKKKLVRAFYDMREQLLLESGDFRRVDVNHRHQRGVTNPHGLDIDFRLDLTKLVMHPTRENLAILERLTGVPMDDILADTPLPDDVRPSHPPRLPAQNGGNP